MSNYARIGGILAILSGVFAIFPFMAGVMYIVMPQFIKDIPEYPPSVPGQPNITTDFFLFFTIFGAVICLFSVILGALAITGGVFALKKKIWAVAIAGAAAGTILFYPCGIAATILVSLGKPEFEADQSMSPLQ